MSTGVTRRQFLGQGAAGVAALSATQAAALAASGEASGARSPGVDNPWRYDVDALARVDPALVRYSRAVSFPVGPDAPRRLAIAPGGRIWVAAGTSARCFTGQGGQVSELRFDEPVRAVFPHQDGTLWVSLRNTVERWSAEGRREWRSPAFAGKAFLTGLAVAGEDLWVADSGNRVVYRCDLNGRVQLRLGERNPGRNIPGLVLPSPFLDLRVGADGLLRVNNPGRHRVETYNRDGDLEAGWGRPGVAIDSFCGCCNPISIALLADGRCVTGEKGLPRVKVFTADGALESVVAAPDSFAAVASEARDARPIDTLNDGMDVAVDAEGRVAVLDRVGATVQVFARKS